jgi:hypothetical protein
MRAAPFFWRRCRIVRHFRDSMGLREHFAHLAIQRPAFKDDFDVTWHIRILLSFIGGAKTRAGMR